VTADPLVLTAEVDRATQRLIQTARTLDDAGVAAPSLLPGWTRGHVLTHVARNADGMTNLLTWARTGVKTPQYASLEQRAADIEAGAARPIAEHVADLEATAARFTEAAAAVPAEAWSVIVQGTGSQPVEAVRVVWGRLREVEVHHVDLAAGYQPSDWPEAFVHRLLHEIADGYPDGLDGVAVCLRSDDLGHELMLGPAGDGLTVSGPGYALAAWLTGRSTGDNVTVSPPGRLPAVPSWR
jgi:maleylpyruvate isomerase